MALEEEGKDEGEGSSCLQFILDLDDLCIFGCVRESKRDEFV